VNHIARICLQNYSFITSHDRQLHDDQDIIQVHNQEIKKMNIKQNSDTTSVSVFKPLWKPANSNIEAMCHILFNRSRYKADWESGIH